MECILGARGQITVPRAVRDKLNLQVGDEIAMVIVDNSVRMIPRNKPVSELFSQLEDLSVGMSATLDDYDSAIGEGISQHVEKAKAGKGKEAA